MNNGQRKMFSTEQQFQQQQNPMGMSLEPQRGRSGIRTNAPTVQKRPARTPGNKWQPSEDQIERDGRSVCVRNLDKRIDEDMLKRLFKTAGNVVTITLNKDKQGVSKGYAYIEFSSADAKFAAINHLNGQDVCGNGRTIIVEPKRVNESDYHKKRSAMSQQAILAKAISQIVRMSTKRGRGGRGGRGQRGRGGMNQGPGEMGGMN